ncbi:uncharacterized protein LOC128270725 [Anopheles cruzii]|uniref:uncharacterized protein LOC128270725 n=1 Tax=Anopheles cruzii TaxID=68878 RepID=UPI0022EC6CAA|nr:uncharacterized protein LOC128270725 [Anopheles cruzii]XP_052864212.1 uncharacterized protein LOC128270725 [Anopheles cruzii]
MASDSEGKTVFRPTCQQRIDFDPCVPVSMRRKSMVNNQFLSDVTFDVGPSHQKIFAHKILLATASEYFYGMFSGNFVETRQPEIRLEWVDAQLFITILRYIYCGTDAIVLNVSNLRDIYSYSQRFMLNELNDEVRKFLERRIEKDGPLQVLTDNRFFEFPSVDDNCLQIIRKNPLFYFNIEKFLEIDKVSLDLILCAQQINCTDDQLLTAFDIWNGRNNFSEEEAKEMKEKILNGKRSYNCTKLHLFGGQMFAMDSEAEALNFYIQSDNDIELYGIGVYIKSTSQVVEVHMTIEDDNDTEITSDMFEYENKLAHTVGVADLFFEKTVLYSHCSYKISLRTHPRCDIFLLSEPYVCHDSMRLNFTQPDGPNQYVHGLAHFFCEERPSTGHG